jgi:hypothetical protein
VRGHEGTCRTAGDVSAGGGGRGTGGGRGATTRNGQLSKRGQLLLVVEENERINNPVSYTKQ